MIKTIVMGAGGRMGGRIITMIAQTEGVELSVAVEKQGHLAVGKDSGELAGLGKNGIIIEDDFENALDRGDVVIDFTHHVASVEHIKLVVQKRKAIVIGTTGFSGQELMTIKELATKCKCVLAPNMSVGVNVMLKVLHEVAGILGDDYDVEIVESHHNLKKDAPSGTAMKMAQVIADSLHRDLDEVGVYER
ncbi:MAG: 4-hydroxy-tetrahydrodipicolinate reductase, partial [Deltaproteobacteria bacterium]